MKNPTTYAEREKKRLHILLNAAASGNGIAHICESQQKDAMAYLTEQCTVNKVRLETFPVLADFLKPAQKRMLLTLDQK